MALVFILSSTGEPRGSRAGPAITLISFLCWCAASPQAVWCMRLPRGALVVPTRQTADEATGSWYALRDISTTSPLVYTATASGFWTAPGRVIGHISSYPQNGQFLTPGCLSFLGRHLNGSAMAGPRRPAIRARVEAARCLAHDVQDAIAAEAGRFDA